jgi:hypothetical protein
LNVITSAILGLAILYLVIRYRRFHQAFRSWQEKQLEEDYGVSEALRNQTLQALFGIRRQIEQMPLGGAGAQLLEEVHQCQQDLTQLSDRLFSIYGLDSVPLALKDLWRDVVDQPSTIEFEVRGEVDTGVLVDRSAQAQVLNGQLLLVWLRKILQAGLKEDHLVRVVVDLMPQTAQWWRPASIGIKIQFCCADRRTCDRLMADSDLRWVAQLLTHLTPGRCYLKQEDTCLCCWISWMLTFPSFPSLSRSKY